MMSYEVVVMVVFGALEASSHLCCVSSEVFGAHFILLCIRKYPVSLVDVNIGVLAAQAQIDSNE